MAAAVLVCSCNKSNLDVAEEPLQESVLYVNLSEAEETRAAGAGHGVQNDDNHVQTLELFVFRINPGASDDGILDGYRKFTAAELGNLSNLEIKTTTGNKMIYALANSHRESWKGVNTRELFEQQTALLADEDTKSFIMAGATEAQLQMATTVYFYIKRLVARVEVNSIKTAFKGGPYEGMELKNVKAYLLNAQAEKRIHNNSGNNLTVYNKGMARTEDIEACVMPGAIYDDLQTNVSDEGYDTPHYFYTFENSFATETEEERFTRIVIEGELDGTVYYYPVALKEIRRNCCYSLDITITRPGSLDPDSDVSKGVMLSTLTVKDWEKIPDKSVEF